MPVPSYPVGLSRTAIGDLTPPLFQVLTRRFYADEAYEKVVSWFLGSPDLVEAPRTFGSGRSEVFAIQLKR